MDIEPDIGPAGALKGINGEVAIEMADIAYKTGSICAARRGFDLDEVVEGYDMQTIRRTSGLDTGESEETELEWDGNVWESADK
ncbi:MAG TPA: hypothetical protein VKA37_07925 [Halobacteriales archaeon]|nr:hypothetical protein [Halobacteriales archaeon]